MPGHHHGGGEKAVSGDPLGRLEPGSSREKALAASIMPAAKPSMASSTRWGTDRRNRAGRAPSAVAANPGGAADEAITHPGADVTGRQHDETLQQEQQHGGQGEQQPQGDEGAIRYLLAQLD